MEDTSRKTIRVGDKHLPLPKSKFARILLGVLCIFGGILGFLPILGFWMIPLGLFILSYDIPAVDRQRRKLKAWWQARRSKGNADQKPDAGDPPVAL